MEKALRGVAFGVFVVTILSGCLNMPTSQTTGSRMSGIEYDKYECARLWAELDFLKRRENHLVVAQEQRQMQAFWWGPGQVDGGMDASELANVRCEKKAVLGAMAAKGCR